MLRFIYRKLTSRAGIFVLPFLLVTPVAIWIALRISQAIEVKRVEILLNRIKGLRVRETTFQETQQLAKEYPGHMRYSEGNCDAEECEFSIYFGYELVDRFDFINGVLRSVGVRQFVVGASVKVRNGLLVKKGFSILAETRIASPCGQWLAISGTTEDHFPHSDYYYGRYLGLEEHPNHQVIKPHLTTNGGGQALNAAVTPDATLTEQERTYDFRLPCLSSLGGCSELEEIAPSAWEDYLSNHKVQNQFNEESRFGLCSDRTLARLSRDIDNILLVQVEKVFPLVGSGTSFQDVKFQLVEILKGKTDKHLAQFPLTVAKGSPTADRVNPTLAPELFSPGKRVVLFLKENDLDFVPFVACEVIPADRRNLLVIRQSIRQLNQGLPITALK